MSYLRTAILLAGLTALFMGVGYLIGGPNGALIAFLFAAAMNFFAYWNADRMVLSMHGAQEVDENPAPQLVHMVAGLANRAGLPIPRVYLMDNPQPNAFATGRNPAHAAVAVTTGLLHMLSRDELGGRYCPRARPYQKSRHAPDDDHRHHCRCHLDAGAVRDVFRWRPSRQQ